MSKTVKYKTIKCIGIFGFLFGHKYIKSEGGFVWTDRLCFRCGHERGTFITEASND